MTEFILWAFKAVAGALIALSLWLIRKQDDRMDRMEAENEETRTMLDQAVQDQLRLCASKHEEEGRRFTDYATKGDVTDIKRDINGLRSDIQSINTNILAIARDR